VTAVGLFLGAASSLLTTLLIRSLLFEVQPMVIRVLLSVAMLLAAVGAVACVIPARRATKVDPVEAILGH
jgi:putative ABC transport system permease protein